MKLESDMIQPLLSWLWIRRRIRRDTIVVLELPWLGRRVDLATLTASGSITAYEFKVAKTTIAIETSDEERTRLSKKLCRHHD